MSARLGKKSVCGACAGAPLCEDAVSRDSVPLHAIHVELDADARRVGDGDMSILDDGSRPVEDWT